MKRKLTLTAFCLLLTVFSYSQTVLTDNNGDTLVTISLEQMDRIYTELIQKDSLTAQSYINASNELLLLQIVDSADRDIKSLKTSVNSLSEDNVRLYEIAKDKDVKITRNRKISFASVCVAILAILIR
jgi:hypothetical protein